MAKIIEEIVKRRASRAVASDKTVEAEKIAAIIEAGSLAPSCFNNQPWRFVVVDERERRESLIACLASGNYWARNAAAIIAVAAKYDLDCRLDDARDYALFDTGLAVQNCLLQAVREGLIAHPIAGFDAVRAKQLLGIPGDYILITLIIIGYRGDSGSLDEKHRILEAAARERKKSESFCFYNTWNE